MWSEISSNSLISIRSCSSASAKIRIPSSKIAGRDAIAIVVGDVQIGQHICSLNLRGAPPRGALTALAARMRRNAPLQHSRVAAPRAQQLASCGQRLAQVAPVPAPGGQ